MGPVGTRLIFGPRLVFRIHSQNNGLMLMGPVGSSACAHSLIDPIRSVPPRSVATTTYVSVAGTNLH
jgi:hypothetical protein